MNSNSPEHELITIVDRAIRARQEFIEWEAKTRIPITPEDGIHLRRAMGRETEATDALLAAIEALPLSPVARRSLWRQCSDQLAAIKPLPLARAGGRRAF